MDTVQMELQEVEYTVEGLREMKRQLLADALKANHAAVIADVVTALGTVDAYTIPHDAGRYTWRHGDITAVVDTALGTVMVVVGGKLAASVDTPGVTGEQISCRKWHGGTPSGLFVPGPWLDIVYDHVDAAREEREKRARDAYDRERHGLMDELWLLEYEEPQPEPTPEPRRVTVHTTCMGTIQGGIYHGDYIRERYDGWRVASHEDDGSGHVFVLVERVKKEEVTP